MDSIIEYLGSSVVVSAAVTGAFNWFLANRRANLRITGDRDALITKGELDQQLDIVRGAAEAMASGYTASSDRRLQAIAAVWSNISSMRQFAAPVLYIYDVYKPGPYGDSSAISDELPIVSEDEWLRQFLCLLKDDEQHRPFIGEHIWQEYYVYRALMGRIAVRLLRARELRCVPIWNEALVSSGSNPDILGLDEPLVDALNLILGEQLLNRMCIEDCRGVPRRILTTIETKMMRCMNAWVFGDELAIRDMKERLKLIGDNSIDSNLTLLKLRLSAEQHSGTPIP